MRGRSAVTAFAQIDVNGPGTSPVYAFLKSRFPGDVRWNFATKFIVDREGQVPPPPAPAQRRRPLSFVAHRPAGGAGPHVRS